MPYPMIQRKSVLMETTFCCHSLHNLSDENVLLSCLCWHCTKPAFCCFPSIPSLPLMMTVDTFVHVNMHSFLSCFLNMHSLLTEQNDIPQISLTLSGVGWKYSVSLNTLSYIGWLLWLFMQRPTVDSCWALFCFSVRFSQQPCCFESATLLNTTVVKCSRTLSSFFMTLQTNQELRQNDSK